MKKIFSLIFFIVFVNQSQLQANPSDAQKWLNSEIKLIIDLYQDDNTPIELRLEAIEKAINTSFAGTGIARFVVGNVWENSNEEVKKEFIILFKEHLYLTIGTLMQGYSSQSYELIGSKKDKSQSVYLVDMEIKNNEQKILIVWRVKKSKNKYYVIDLLVADISLVITKRAEFNSMLKKADNDLNELNILLKKQNLLSYNNLIN